MDKSQTSIIPLSLTLTANDSGFNFFPLHTVQGVSRMNCFSHSRFDSESVSIKERWRLDNTPSNTLVYCQEESPDLELYLKSIMSLDPYKIIRRCFGVIFSIVVIKSNPNFSPTALNACFLNAENLPLHGTIAPSKMDLLLSGITRSASNSIFIPNPLHALHIPNGELNENVLGSRSPMVNPQYGHALFCENIFSDFSDEIMTSPFDVLIAVCIASNSLERSDFSVWILSTTISMLCHFCLSSAGNCSSRLKISPSRRILEYPSFFICSNNFSYVPFFL